MHHDWPLQATTNHRGQFASVMGGTLGRHVGRAIVPPNLQYPAPPPPAHSTFRAGGGGYPLYHTCERPSTSKKRVTIVEDNNTESSV